MATLPSKPRNTSAVLIQLLAICGAFGALAAVPPAVGRMLLLPVTAGASHGMLTAAIDHGARLIGPGPLPGSYVVEGDRAALLTTLVRHGVALLAAPAAGCGQ